jgi:hypothetical protein
MSNKRPLSEIQWFEKDEMQEIAAKIRTVVDELNGKAYRQTFEYKGWQIDFSAGEDNEGYYMDEFTMSPISFDLSTKIINL